jgi:hypothetical protein
MILARLGKDFFDDIFLGFLDGSFHGILLSLIDNSLPVLADGFFHGILPGLFGWFL